MSPIGLTVILSSRIIDRFQTLIAILVFNRENTGKLLGRSSFHDGRQKKDFWNLHSLIICAFVFFHRKYWDVIGVYKQQDR
jgi:hypothetical protein